jgi:hypothetical protein
MRVAVPLVLFVLLIAGIAWVSQYLPSWKEDKPIPPPPQSPVRFTAITTEEQGPQGYHQEFERDVRGHLDYVFLNEGRASADVGVNWKQCVCSGVQIALLTPQEARPLLDLEKEANESLEKHNAALAQAKLAKARTLLVQLTAALDERWKEMQLDDTKGIEVPSGGCGVMRVHWRPHAEDPAFEVSVVAWVKPAGVAFRDRLFLQRKATVALVAPVRLFPRKMDVGRLLAGTKVTKSFLFWSATRDKVEVQVTAEPDPCLTWKVEPLSADRFAHYEKVLGSPQFGILTRIRSACLLTATLYEQRKGKQLDMGAIILPIPVQVKADGEMVDVPNPVLIGKVDSDIVLVQDDDVVDKFGQINLGPFKRSQGIKRTARLVTRAGVDLKVITQDPQFFCQLTKLKGPNPEPVWELEITVPPDVGLDAGKAVVLEEREAGRPPRRIRIHVVGVAAQG